MLLLFDGVLEVLTAPIDSWILAGHLNRISKPKRSHHAEMTPPYAIETSPALTPLTGAPASSKDCAFTVQAALTWKGAV